jgi:thiamine-monophosphate kinase
MSDSEFDLIQDFFAGLDQGPSVRLGIGDDAAALSLPDGHLLHISTDTTVEGVHFLATLSPTDVAYRSVMAAASDLAAMGASPRLFCSLSRFRRGIGFGWRAFLGGSLMPAAR